MDKTVEKERLLREIKYYSSRIENFNKETKSKLCLDSSDSEDDLPTFRTPGPLISELRTTESGLQTSLQATQELTSLTVLQYETNVLVEPPKIKRGKPITEPGIWREITAECRLDAIHFSINFCTYQDTKKFAPVLYRNLSVLPVKKVHELELGQSVLPDVTRPSDAIEVLKSFASAFRSRRTSLARLANKYTNIELEPAAEGGYLLKCGSVLAITWRLENKWTPLTPFHHKMKFDLDYMGVVSIEQLTKKLQTIFDKTNSFLALLKSHALSLTVIHTSGIEEDQLKIIKQAHKKISDPTINTDERTLLLAKIISTCLELKATQDESMDSEAESTKKTDRTIIEDGPDDNLIIEHENKNNISKNDDNNEGGTNLEGYRDVNVEKKTEKEIMAPPKSLPKKAKPKGKENKVDNRKSVKRTADEAAADAKKAKTGENVVANENTKQFSNEVEVTKDKNSKVSVNKQKTTENQVNEVKQNTQKSDKNSKNYKNVTGNQNNQAKNDKTRPNTAENSKQIVKKPVKTKIDVQNEGSQPKKAKVDKNQVTVQNVNKNHVQKSNVVDKVNENNKQNEVTQSKIPENSQTVAPKQPADSNKQKIKQSLGKESTANTDKNKKIITKNVSKSSVQTKNQVKPISVSDKPTKPTTGVEKNTKTTTGTDKPTKPTTEKPAKPTEKPTKSNPSAAKNNENLSKNYPKSTKVVKNPTAGPSTSKSTENPQKNSNKQINIGKNVQNTKNLDKNKASEIPKITIQKSTPNDPKKQTSNKNSNVVIAKNVNKPKLTIKSHSIPSKIKKPGSIGDKNSKGIVKSGIISKIPQNKFVATSTPVNFMWVSPRNRPTSSETNLLNTNIPRLLKKPVAKTN